MKYEFGYNYYHIIDTLKVLIYTTPVLKLLGGL